MNHTGVRGAGWRRQARRNKSEQFVVLMEGGFWLPPHNPNMSHRPNQSRDCEGAVIMCDMGIESRGLEGLRVLSLESRRAEQMAKLIENHGGIPVSAPSMREVPLGENPAALAFAADLFAGKFDAVIFLTGVGTRILFGAVASMHPR